ncbi:hypothetical protein RXO96_26980, partial [Pseudomonas aeruginosa]|nr:hypothetical protein [Pseudomonas aeruginosa]
MGAYKIESHIFSVPLEWEKLVALGAEVDPWQSDAGRTTQFALGAEVDPWQSDAGRTTQFALGAEARTWHTG